MTDSGRPLVTIGISTYNRANGYLREALGSAVAQTYPSLEIIVSDNCSEDDTEAVVRSFEDPRIRYIRHERNIGGNNNFNYCLEQAKGSYFLLLHDDDRIDPDFIAACMDAARDDTRFGLIRTGARVIDGKGEILSEWPNDAMGLSPAAFFLAWFDARTPFYLCNTLYSTERLREAGGFHSRRNLFQDVIATVRLAARHDRVDVHDVKASFRRHGANAGKAEAVTRWCDDALQVVDVMCEEVPSAADVLRQEGLIYFTRTTYRYAGAIESWTERVGTYWHVYRRLGYAYSPIQLLYAKVIRKQMRRLRRRVSSGGLELS